MIFTNLSIKVQNLSSKPTIFQCKVKNCNSHKNKIRTNEPKIWKNSKNNEAQPKLSGSYKKSVDHSHNNVTFCEVLICPQNKADSGSNFEGYKNIFGCAGKKKDKIFILKKNRNHSFNGWKDINPQRANFRVTFALGLRYITCSERSVIKKRIKNVLFREQNW